MERRDHVQTLKIQLPDCCVKLIVSFLMERASCMRIHDYIFSEIHVTLGVSQVSILGPLLSCVYFNNVPKKPRVQIALFA